MCVCVCARTCANAHHQMDPDAEVHYVEVTCFSTTNMKPPLLIGLSSTSICCSQSMKNSIFAVC